MTATNAMALRARDRRSTPGRRHSVTDSDVKADPISAHDGALQRGDNPRHGRAIAADGKFHLQSINVTICNGPITSRFEAIPSTIAISKMIRKLNRQRHRSQDITPDQKYPVQAHQ
jgi:hypothetical protein